MPLPVATAVLAVSAGLGRTGVPVVPVVRAGPAAPCMPVVPDATVSPRSGLAQSSLGDCGSFAWMRSMTVESVRVVTSPS